MPRTLRLRRLAQLEVRTPAEDGAGGVVDAWFEIAEHWVALQPVSGPEIHEAARDATRITHRVQMRSPRALSPRASQRFRINNRLFDIRAVFDRDGRGRYLTCLVEERQTQ